LPAEVHRRALGDHAAELLVGDVADRARHLLGQARGLDGAAGLATLDRPLRPPDLADAKAERADLEAEPREPREDVAGQERQLAGPGAGRDAHEQLPVVGQAHRLGARRDATAHHLRPLARGERRPHLGEARALGAGHDLVEGRRRAQDRPVATLLGARHVEVDTPGEGRGQGGARADPKEMRAPGHRRA